MPSFVLLNQNTTIIIDKVFEHYSITFKNVWEGYKIFLDPTPIMKYS